MHSDLDGAAAEIDTMELDPMDPNSPTDSLPTSPGRTWSRKRKNLQKYACMRLRWAAQDLYSAGVVLVVTLWNFEALFAMINCVLATFFYLCMDVEGFGMVSNLSWTFVAIVIVFPLTYEVNMSFRRREEGLRLLASLMSTLSAIAMAHLQWDWNKGGGGRDALPEDYKAQVLECLTELVNAIVEYLKFPLVTRARNFFTEEGARELALFEPDMQDSFNLIYTNICKLSQFVEVLKSEGLPANEASRINQWHQFLTRDIEHLRNIKEYRTPQGTRSLARVFIQLTPWIYGPYFLWIAHGADQTRTLEGYMFAFIVMTVVVLSMVALYNVQRALQDPFDEDGLDDIRISKMRDQLIRNFKTCQNCSKQIEETGTVVQPRAPRSPRSMPMTEMSHDFSPGWFKARRSNSASNFQQRLS